MHARTHTRTQKTNFQVLSRCKAKTTAPIHQLVGRTGGTVFPGEFRICYVSTFQLAWEPYLERILEN